MLVRWRIALLAAAGSLVVAAAAETPAPAASVRPSASPSAPSVLVRVEGTLVVAEPDGPGARPAYAVALGGGDLVPVTGSLAHARSLSHFVGRLAVPASVSSDLSVSGAAMRGGGVLDATSPVGRRALRLVDRRSLTLPVVGTPVLTAPRRAGSPTSHQQYVAAWGDATALGQNDTQLLAHVSTVGSYWEHESNGAISGIGVPTTVTHYDTALTSSDCGLGSDFFSVVQEAEKQFPGVSFGGTAQLVLFVPPSCSSGGVVGEGTVGSSFASGGALIVKAGTAIEGTYAHETGHNYGFAHSNARWSGTSMEYFGVYDVMGFALGGGVNQLTALSTPFRVFEGVTDPGEIQKVDLGDGTSPVHVAATIAPRSDDTGLRSVRVTDPDTGETLYLDYRSGTGQDAGAFYGPGRALSSNKGTVHYAPGVTISAARGGSGVDTLVLDGGGDTSLAAGTTWRNASGDLTVRVTSTSSTGADVTIRYRPPLQRLATTRPTIVGHPRVGKRLTAVPGAWTHGTTFHYQWFVGSKAVKHATSKRLVLTKAQRGERLRVRVTGTKSGFHARTLTSARTVKVT